MIRNNYSLIRWETPIFLISLIVFATILSAPDVNSTPFTIEDGNKVFTLVPENNLSTFDVTSLYYPKYDSLLLGESLILFAFFAILAVFATPYLRQKILLSAQLSGLWRFVAESVLMQKSENTESEYKKITSFD